MNSMSNKTPVMLDSFIADLSLIKETLDKEEENNFFGRNFSLFAAEPTLFYDSEKEVIIYVNDQFAKELHYTLCDLSSWKYSIFPLLHIADQDLFRESLKTLFESKEEYLHDTGYRLIVKDKGSSYYKVRLRKLYKKVCSIQIENAVNIIAPDAQVKEYESMLEQKIDELNKSNRELEEFAYVASHDMQEPLRKISTFGQRLRSQFSMQLEEDGKMYLDRMLNASESMRNLIEISWNSQK